MTQAERLMMDAQRLHRKGSVDDALKLYERILKMQPRLGAARLYMAIIQCQKGLVHDALANARRAIDDTEHPDVVMYSNYGVMLKNAGLYQESALAYRQALQRDPQNPGVKANLATLYMALGRMEEAEPILRELVTQTEEPAPWLNLARIALLRNDMELVDDCLRQAEDLDGTHVDIFVIRAARCLREQDHPGAWNALKKVFAIAPAHAESWQNVQNLDQSVLEFAFLEQALGNLARINTQSATTLAACVDICRKNLLWEPLPALERQLAAMLQKPFEKAPSDSATFTLLAANVPQTGHLQSARASWAASFGSVGTAARAKQRFEVPPKNQIRVGFLSSDFRTHAVGCNLVGVMEKLPRGRVTWYAYSNSFDDEKKERGRFRMAFDRFINVAKLSDDELTRRIRQDEIDVLIDLNGITAETRIRVMACRAAPVQASWFGMAGSPGSHGAIDYYFGDAVAATPENAAGFDECMVVLPHSYHPADHERADLSSAGTRQDHGLPDKAVVFCSFNQHYKLSPDTFSIWVRLLHEVHGSVLWLLKPKAENIAQRLQQLFADAGIAKERVILAPSKPQAEHKARITHADLFLDSWPYNAHSTAVDALSVGVPVVTLPGSTYASRVAASLLTAANLPEWIAATPEAYFRKAFDFATQERQRIDAAKQHVLDTFWASPMVDTEAFARKLENLCVGLYARAAAGLPPVSLRLHDDGTLEPLSFGRSATSQVPSVESDEHSHVDSSGVDQTTETPLKTSPQTPHKAHGSGLDIRRGSRDARLHNLGILRRDVMGMAETPLVMDIRNPAVDGDEQHFEALADAGLVRILGFEPDKDGYGKLIKAERPHREYVCAALGDGKEAVCHLCAFPEMNSLLRPDQSWLSLISGYGKRGEVVRVESLSTTRLDDVPQAKHARYIKMDMQGSELQVLQNGVSCLQQVAMLQLECSPVPWHHGEASFFEVGEWLRQQGFILHHFAGIKKGYFQPYGNDKNPYGGLNHVFQTDVVFVPDPRTFPSMETNRLLALAFFSHALYRSFDLAELALHHLDLRDGENRQNSYKMYLEQAKLEA